MTEQNPENRADQQSSEGKSNGQRLSEPLTVELFRTMADFKKSIASLEASQDKFVTKSDLEKVVREVVDGLRTDLKADINRFSIDLNGVKSDLKADLNGVKTDLKADINRVSADLDGVKKELKADINRVSTELGVIKTGLTTVNGQVESVKIAQDGVDKRVSLFTVFIVGIGSLLGGGLVTLLIKVFS
ncbi:MAG: CCDC90 family protein [Deltaproteobacteria bacterium]|jgi:uncharacterized protein YpuA (DUF1002 family)|nr:CCDC90 family protein [Deltaproteobacteria bacterium]